jgi:ectoine hydroxylase-related dioxygenase (phytanoyl-CoA dioxygenase family)
LDWIVRVSHDERAFGSLNPANANLAYTSLRENGCVLLRGAFQERIVDAMQREFAKQYGSHDAAAMAERSSRPAPNPVLEVGERRYEITLEMSGAFAAPEVFANPLLVKFLLPLLGSELRLSGFTAVVSYPGATAQHIHRDHGQLFPDQSIGPELPVYAINVTVPLIDVDIQTGPTAVWLGSHRSPDSNLLPGMQSATIEPFRRGDAILIDYRTLHTGLPNVSATVRPIAYLVYTRTWFFDEINHRDRSSLDMPLATYRSMPQYTQTLLLRAFRHAMLTEGLQKQE